MEQRQNLSSLPLRLQQEGIMIPHDAESFFEFTVPHILMDWGILVVFTIVFAGSGQGYIDKKRDYEEKSVNRILL